MVTQYLPVKDKIKMKKTCHFMNNVITENHIIDSIAKDLVEKYGDDEIKWIHNEEWLLYPFAKKICDKILTLNKTILKRMDSPLYYSFYKGKYDILDYLLNIAKINGLEYQELANQILDCAYQGDITAAEICLKYGADANYWNSSPLTGACTDGKNLEIIRWLIKNGADITSHGLHRPMEYAIMCRNVDAVKELINAGVDIHHNNDIFFFWSIMYNNMETSSPHHNVDCTKYFLENGCKIQKDWPWYYIEWTKIDPVKTVIEEHYRNSSLHCSII